MRIGPMSVVMVVIYLFIGIFDQTLDPTLQGYGNGGTGFILATIFQPWNWSGHKGYVPRQKSGQSSESGCISV